jgi:ribonuclease HIII
MQNFTTNLKSDEVNRLHHLLKAYQVIKPHNPYLLYFYKVGDHTISIFTSHKLLIQGDHANKFYQKLINGKETIPSVKKRNTLTQDYIGCDEVGVGDYFGGLVTCAVYLKDITSEKALRVIGVCDSKKLIDAEMIKMFPQIIKACPYECAVISPHKYNELVKRFNNTHIVKSYLHDQTIKKLVKRLKLVESTAVVMDQFAPENTYYAYFTKIGVTPYQITHFETKAENKYLAVAAASIIARVAFLQQIKTMSKTIGMPLLLGASNPEIINQARAIYSDGGLQKLSQFAKIDFATTKKVIQ